MKVSFSDDVQKFEQCNGQLRLKEWMNVEWMKSFGPRSLDNSLSELSDSACVC